MVERRTLEDVLNDLKEAEKEYNEKCLIYGITEKRKRKKDELDSEALEENDTSIGEEEVPIEVQIENEPENSEETSEN